MAKKALEKSRREAKKRSHQQLVSRVLSKQFLKGLKVNTFILLRDVGYFQDQFKEEILEREVMPWILEQAE